MSVRAVRLRSRRRGTERGITLLEVLVSLGIIAMISVLLYGTFDSLSRGRKGEGTKSERARQGRAALLRLERELSSAFLSAHQARDTSLVVRKTAFMARGGARFSRVDFAAFAHQRTDSNAKESDQAEIGYFIVRNPKDPEKYDLARREETPINLEPDRGGVVNVLVEDIEGFELHFLDAQTGLWTDNWDSTSTAGQPNRLPLEVHVVLKLAHVPPGSESVFTTKFMLPMLAPLAFGISQ